MTATLLLFFSAFATSAQDLARSVEGPEADWRTLTTEHFRVHYPAGSETWALHAAARLESIRAAVAAEVGFFPEETVDVLVSDPVAAANGFALPLLGGPRMVLWTSPPGPDSVIGHYRDWAELLLVHEDTHLVHLLRPSRNPWRRALARLVPLGPVARAPRWVSEGYATQVEGRLTGTGRPNADLRAAVLRRWAQEGKLPSYPRLASDEDSYLGMSMAYLAGSAYLEWLQGRAGEGSLRDLWARMTARRARSFEAAFEGVFGDPPHDLWDRFTAELTWQAVEVERRLARSDAEGVEAAAVAAAWVEGEAWLDLAWATGAPAVSPDGSMFALVLRHREDPAELAVYATEVDRDAIAQREERRREIAEADPLDVPAVDRGPLPRRRLFTLPTIDGAAPSQPRWLPTPAGGGDGAAAESPGALLLVRYLPDAEGILHPDLFRWTLGRTEGDAGELARLTRGADLRDPDPAPDGAWAAAVRNRHGLSQLVRVALPAAGGAGRVEAITEPAVGTVYDAPRVSPDGERLVYARHAAGAWGLVVRDLATGAEEELPLPPAATVASPAWGRGEDGGTVYAVVGRGGFIDVFAFRRSEGREEEGGGEAEIGGEVGGGEEEIGDQVDGEGNGGGEEDGSSERGGGEGIVDGGKVAWGGGDWTVHRVTRSRGAALAPEPAPAVGEEPAGLFFLALEPDGLDLRRLALEEAVVSATRSAMAGAPSSPAGSGGGAAAGSVAAPEAEPAPRSIADPFAVPVAVPGLAPAVRPEPPAAPVVFTAAEVAPGEPSGVQRLELLPLSGGAFAAEGSSFEAGLRAGDLLGRLDLVATGAWGGDGAATGGALAASWRRLPVALSLHAVTVKEEPSRQDAFRSSRQPAPDSTGAELGSAGAGDAVMAPPLADAASRVDVAGGALDVERQGMELAAAWERLAGGGPLRLAGGAWLGRAEPRHPGPRQAGGARDETSLFAEASWAPWTGRGRWSAGLGLEGRADAGDTGGASWRRLLGGVRLSVRRDDATLAAAWRYGEANGEAVDALPAPAGGGEDGAFSVAAPWQLFQVGGLPSSLRPSSLAAPRLPVPALPAARLVGQRVEAQRVDLRTELLPLPLFWSRHRVGADGAGEGGWRSLAGVEWRGAIGPVPLLRLPRLALTAGAAEQLDGPAEGDREAWLTLTWSP